MYHLWPNIPTLSKLKRDRITYQCKGSVGGGGGGGRLSLQKKMFSPFGPQFSLNIMGGPRHPGAPPPLDPLLTKHVGEYRKLVLLYYMFTEICLFTKLNLKK